jgi:hypothetical protein
MINGFGELSVEADPCWDTLISRAQQLGELICQLTPESRERSLSLTRLDETVMWFRAALLRTPRAYYYGRGLEEG